MRETSFSNDPLAGLAPGARRFAMRCAHATTEFDYLPDGLPPVLRLSDLDATRMVLIRHAAATRCACTAPLPANTRSDE